MKKSNILSTFITTFLFVFSLGVMHSVANAQVTEITVSSPQTRTSQTFYFSPNGATTTIMGTTTLVGTTTPVSTAVNPVNTFQAFTSFGDSGADVLSLQKFLNSNGANIKTTGYFGPVTKQEVKNLQYTYGLPVTGNQYKLTTALINALNSGAIVKKSIQVCPNMYPTKYVSNSTKDVLKIKKVAYKYNFTQPEIVIHKPIVNTIEQKIQNTQNKVAQIIANNVNTQKLSSSSIPALSGNPNMATSTFAKTFSNEIQNVKDNYKSYLIVLLLVAALFWFLKKTATE